MNDAFKEVAALLDEAHVNPQNRVGAVLRNLT